jgi:23S rRNA pseudouridine1911/1915/1917 synthase
VGDPPDATGQLSPTEQLNPSEHVLHFPGGEAQRLDKYLAGSLGQFSRARLQNLIKDGRVYVDGKPAAKTGQILDRPVEIIVSVPAPVPSNLQAESVPLNILFENDDVMVVDKPAGMVVHPAAGHASGTLVNAALGHAPELEGIGGEQRPGVVHRLDKETSGLILLAKNERSHRWLQDQFRLRKVEKVYIALVDGHPPTPTGRVEAPIGRDPKQRRLMAVVSAAKGRAAVSEYRTLESFPQHTLLEVHPVTGRTHQIRLHMAFLDCPITGDTVYGLRKSSLPLNRHFLHAQLLTIRLLNENEPRTFTAPLPVELEKVLEMLRTR